MTDYFSNVYKAYYKTVKALVESIDPLQDCECFLAEGDRVIKALINIRMEIEVIYRMNPPNRAMWDFLFGRVQVGILLLQRGCEIRRQ